MKKLANVIALFILVSVNVLTPVSYAGDVLEVALTDDKGAYVQTEALDAQNNGELKDKGIKYGNGIIAISDGEDEIWLRDKNVGVSENINMKDKMQDLHNRFCVWAQEECMCSFDLGVSCCDAQRHRSCSNEYYEELKKFFGNYYFWGNNGYSTYSEMNFNEYEYSTGISQLAVNRGFMEGGKIGVENTGWEGGSASNPCDATKGEYLPTPEDWVKLMNIWANLNYAVLDDERNGEGRYKVASLGTSYGKIGFHEYSDFSRFAEDMLLLPAGNIYFSPADGICEADLETQRCDKNEWYYDYYSSYLWTAKDEVNSLGVYDIDYGQTIWGMGYEGISDNYAYPVRCFLEINPVIVSFDTDGGSSVKSYSAPKGSTIIAPTIPTKDGYTFAGWYTEDGTKWDFEQDRVEEDMTLYAKWRFCGEGFTVKSNRCVPDDMDMEGIIEVSDGEDTIYLKDRNEGADRKYDAEKLQVLYDCDDNAISNEDFLSCVNDGLGTSFNDSDDVYDYWDDLEDSIVLSLGTYYFRGNNSGVNYDELEFEDENNYSLITNMEDLNEKFLEGGKLGNSEGDGWVEGKEQNNPCDGDREYLPTPEDRTRLMTIWANKNGYELIDGIVPIDNRPRGDFSVDSLGQYSLGISAMNSEGQLYFSSKEAARNFVQDMLIPESGIVNYDRSSCVTDRGSSCGEMYYRNGMPYLRMAQDKNGYLGGFAGYGVFYDTVEQHINIGSNDMAFPVRCFVDVPEVLIVTLYSDGNIYKELNVVKGDNLVEPVGPNKSNHTFDGWYTEDGEKYDFDIPFTEDVTLYARWTENKSTGGYSGGGGSSSRPSSKGSGSSSSDAKSVDNPKDNTTENKKEETKPEVKPVNNGGGKATSTGKVNPQQELFDAYKWAYANGLTKYANMADARLDDPLNRQEMAKISTLFATKFVDKSPNTKKRTACSQYSDLWKVTSDMEEFIIESCELGYMGYRANGVDYLERFRPYTPVSLAEFSIIISRIMWGNTYALNEKQWYQGHLRAVYENNLIDNITKPFEYITRRDAYLMLYRLTSYL